MRISKWVDMGQDVEIEIGADDIRFECQIPSWQRLSLLVPTRSTLSRGHTFGDR
jgi:hypothetical protein